MHFWMFYAILSAQKNFHPKFFWVKQGETQCHQAFLVSQPQRRPCQKIKHLKLCLYDFLWFIFCNIGQYWKKLEMLGSIVLRLASPKKIWGEKKFGVKIFLSTQDSIKHPEMHKKLKVGKFFWQWKKILDKKKFWKKKKIFFWKTKVT